MKKIFPLILILVAIALAVYAWQLYQDATASHTLLGVEFAVSDQEVKQKSFLVFGLAGLCLLGGLLFWKRA